MFGGTCTSHPSPLPSPGRDGSRLRAGGGRARRALTGWLAGLLTSASAALGQEATGAGTIEGRVFAEGGTPLPGVTVRLEAAPIGAVTGEDGRFRLEGVRPGSRRVQAGRIGYRETTVDVEVTRGGTTRVEIALQEAPVDLGAVTVIGTRRELRELRERMNRIPGGVALVEAEEIRSTRQANLRDVLRFTPGVWVQPRFGAADESQLSVRGSGLRNNFHLRKINIMVNGMPYRNADGFTDFESLELLTAENNQVYKGGNALRHGGSTLGGAINIETRTGHTAEPLQAFGEGGGFGFIKGQVSSGAALGSLNYYASYARTSLDGFREFAAQERDRVNAHLGWKISDRLDARAFYFFAHVDEELPGALTREEFETDRRAPNPTNVADRWGRVYDLHHIGLQLRAQLSPTQRLEVAPYHQYRDIVHPIFRVLDQTSWDWGAELRYENTVPLAGRDHRLTLGFQPAYGRTDNRHFENVRGEAGELRRDQLDEASSLAFYAEDAWELAPGLTGVLGIRWERSTREVRDFFLQDGDQTDRRVFEALLPKLGLLYRAGPEVQLFANTSRSYEPPLLLELNSLTVPGFIELEAQEAWQFEAGARGRAGPLHFDVSAYEMELEGEIHNVNVQPFPGALFTVPTYRNSERSRHYGVETGLELDVPLALATRLDGGDRLRVRLAYTFNRFEYVEDEIFEGNEIPGAPEHVVQAELRWLHPVGLSVAPTLEWVPGSYFVDSGNVVRTDGWTVLGARAEWRLARPGLTLFAEVRNLTDETYSASVQVDDAAGRFFEPADGRSLYAGLRWTLWP